MIRPNSRLADDGKRLLGGGRYTVENSIPEESDERRYTSGSCLTGPWRMTGSALWVVDVILLEGRTSGVE